MAIIFLIGMMGAGKSVTAKSLASLLRWPFVDLDRMIEEKAGCRISEIFKKSGEARFRDLESDALRSLNGLMSLVAATGGGIVLRPENVREMKSRGRIIYLEAGLETLWARVKDNRDRPLLTALNPKGTLEKLYQERRSFYEAACEFRVLTDGRSADDVASEIRKNLGI